MSNLSNQYISSSFQSLLNLQGQGSGLTVNLQTVQDGVGVSSPLKLSTTTVLITGSLVTTGSVDIKGNLVQHDANVDISNSSFVINSGLNNFQVANVGNAFIKSNGANPFSLEGLGSIDNSSITYPLPLNISSSVKITGSLSIEGDTTFKGNLIPSGNFVYDLGSITNQWRSLFVGSGSIYMDDHKILGLDENNSDLQIFAPTGTSIQMVDLAKSNSGLEVTSSFKVDFTGNTGNPLVDITNQAINLTSADNTDITIFASGNGDIYLSAGGSNPRNDVAVNGRVIQYEPGSTPNSLKDTTITGSLGVTNIKGTGSLYLQPNQGDARFVEIYNTSPTDTHITASGGQIFLGDDVTYVKVDNYGSVKHIDIVADNGLNISGSVQITGSLRATNIDNTTITSEAAPSVDGGSNIYYSDGNPPSVINYFFANNITGVTVNGTGVSNAIVTEYGNSGEPNNYPTAILSSGTVTSGATYTFTGLYPTPLSITADKTIFTGSVYSSNGFTSPAGLTIQNADNTGVQYGGVTINCIGVDQENIFSTFGVNNGTSEGSLNIGLSSYTSISSEPIPTIYAGGYYNGDDTTMTFYSGSIDMWKPTRFRALITGSLTISGRTTMSNSTGFPLKVDGTIQTQRFSFVGNPFNTTTGSVFGSLNYDGNNKILQFANGDFGQSATSSYVYLNTDTGSNTTSITNGAGYANTTAETILTNNNGSRSFNVKVDSTSITGSLNVTGSLKVSGNIQFASGSNKTMGTVALDGGNPGTATVSNSLVTTSSMIFLTKQTNNHTNAGPVVVSSKGSSTFTITSNHNGDADIVAYQIINPA